MFTDDELGLIEEALIHYRYHLLNHQIMSNYQPRLAAELIKRIESRSAHVA